MAKYYVMVVDCLGYSQINKNLSNIELVARVEQWCAFAEESSKLEKILKYYLVSDTIFYIVEPTSSGLAKLITIAKFLLEKGIRLSLPVRGGISLGEAFFTENATYGPAIIYAYELCNKQKWIGICINPTEESFQDRKKLLDFEILVSYFVPMEVENVKSIDAVVWDIPDYAELNNLLIDNGLANENLPMEWDIYTKFQNTLIFSMYLKILKLLRDNKEEYSDPQKRYGHTSIQILYNFINNLVLHSSRTPVDLSWLPNINRQ